MFDLRVDVSYAAVVFDLVGAVERWCESQRGRDVGFFFWLAVVAHVMLVMVLAIMTTSAVDLGKDFLLEVEHVLRGIKHDPL